MMLYTFLSVHGLIRGEELLKKKGFKTKIRPLPPEMTSGCGMGLEVGVLDHREICRVFSAKDLEIKAIFREEKGSYKKEER